MDEDEEMNCIFNTFTTKKLMEKDNFVSAPRWCPLESSEESSEESEESSEESEESSEESSEGNNCSTMYLLVLKFPVKAIYL